MGRFLGGFLFPTLLLIAALLSWSLISLADLLAFLFIQYTAPKLGSRCRRQYLITWSAFIFSSLAILSHAIFHIVLAVKGEQWSVADAYWARLIGFSRSIGLVDWSLTSNFLGLFRWWRHLLLYSGFNIVLLYVYQLPIVYSETLLEAAHFFGLFRISAKSSWSELWSASSLLLFYVMLSWIRCDLEEMDFIVSTRESSLTEQLLPKKHSFFIRESRSGVRHTNVLLRRAVFRTFSINFFTYGFPISLLALSFWTFHFASLCAFGLLAYVGYILVAFPPMYQLHRLNGSLLVFILFWAASTYVFNVASAVLKLDEDMKIWETIGLWHYPIPGLYLLAQFGLGVLVAMGNLVNNSVFSYLSDGEGPSTNDNSTAEGDGVKGKEDTTVFIIATIVWGLRKSSLVIVLALLLLMATKPGFIHAVYMVFFMIHLLRHTVGRRLRQSLILLCEAHFALLYILQLNVISKALEQKGSFLMEILTALGLLNQATAVEFLPIALLACFCSIHNHGFDMIFSFSAIVQHAPYPPIGFSILRAGLIKSVLLSVYTFGSSENHQINTSHERKIASYLSAMGQKFLSAYRSWGTYIALSTILLTVYLVAPNYTSFGYLFFLLIWLIGRQILGKTRWQLWFPLKLYAVAVLVLIYSMSVFISFQTWLSRMVDLDFTFGYNKEASVLRNIWESLAVLVVMQLYSYERSHNKYCPAEDCYEQEIVAPSFIKRLLIWHSEKILSLALFYASLSPVSVFGCVYLLGLVISSMLPKTSRVPSTLFLVYSALLAIAEYLFQMWGDQAEMFPGQRRSYLSLLLGLQLYKPGFSGIESGLRSKILVIIACILRYNVFHWLEMMPCDNGSRGKWDEPCTLFALLDGYLPNEEATSPGFSSLNSAMFTPERGSFEGVNTNTYLYSYFWESSKESQKWNRKMIISLRKQRLDMQKTTLKIYIKFWIENMFNLFGLEINMIVLLLASFTVLNAISLLHIIKKLWHVFVFLSASIIILEYLALWLNLISPAMGEAQVPCNDCWRASDVYFKYCKKCWLGTIVEDPRMLLSYFAVFMFSCFKLRADRLSSPYGSQTYRQMISDCHKASVLSDLSFETKGLWTFLDYLRLYSYCHLLDSVLALILITGTLEYDILHLGYLGFALVFFRMRLEILKKKNKIFKFLRIYNFALIVLSLAYQSPFAGDAVEGKCDATDYISEVIGFHKYDYGFRITSRSALVEIVIFMLVSLQSYMFSSKEFDYVSKYLEAEQIGAIVREQEKRADWKTEHLQHIRKSEEKKSLRNMQVEKMKSEMLNLKIQLDSMSTTSNFGNTCAESEGILIRGRKYSMDSYGLKGILASEEKDLKRQDLSLSSDAMSAFDPIESPTSEGTMESTKHLVDTLHEITELKSKSSHSNFFDSERRDNGEKSKAKENPIISAVHLIGDGVSQVQSLGNLAVNNLIHFLNIEKKVHDSDEHSSEDEVYYEVETQNIGCQQADLTASVLQSSSEKIMSDATYSQIGVILRYMWAKMRSNNDIVCYCCFVMMFLWNFSLLSMVYLMALFLYALCINTGPSYMFWIIMLIYTEFCVLLQYLYQIIIQHCGFTLHVSYLQELGFPSHRIVSSFVMSNLPLFLVYLFTLIQTSITTRDSDWANMVTEFSFNMRKNHFQQDFVKSYSCSERIQRLFLPVRNAIKQVTRSLFRYWKSLTEGAETPPYFVQLSMEVTMWPEDSIQPERIESGINRLLKILHDNRCKEKNMNRFHSPSRVQVQSIERSPENSDVALAVFEVVYASPPTESISTEWYKSLTPAADVAGEILTAQRDGILNEIRFPYPILSVIGSGKREIDLYAYTFCADLAVFFLVAIFYQAVIKNKSEFLEVYQLEDQFPKEFVFILMAIFFLIVLDRIIYLRSFATGKVIFFLFNLFLFTYSITRYAWNIELSHGYAGRLALRVIYMTKAISLALQAIQIRFGMPHKSTLYRQFLTSSISQINFLGFRLYRALPFLYELRCVLDWSCTTTSLTMYDWLKMYSSGNPTNIANPIKDASVRIDINTVGGRLILFETTLCEKLSWNELDMNTKMDTHGYLRTYNEQDIQLICCQAGASSLHIIKKLWHVFVFLSASIIILEYLALWLNLISPAMGEAQVPCNDCWRASDVYFKYCKKCWLGTIVEDPRMLLSYFAVFMFSCFKLRADRLSSPYGSQTYRQMISDCHKASVLSDLSFETKGLWTFLDYLRLYSYCHLLDSVLALILITGTLEYDILHLGYLGFALVFFRMRLEILKKKNKIFKFLRIYNFALIVLSLAYQSPFAGDAVEGKCDATDYISEVIGFHKYDYGFRITSRSALVEIVIFMLVSLQSYMFSSKEFDYVSKYLEAEQIGAIVREQEKRADWKTEHLQHIRKSEEKKSLRNMQVEKMKSEMLNLKIQLDSMSTTSNFGNTCAESEGILIRGRKYSMDSYGLKGILASEEKDLKRQDLSLSSDAMSAFDPIESPTSEGTMESTKHLVDTLHEITELKSKSSHSNFFDSERRDNGEKSKAKENPIISAVHLIGDGVSQVQSLGNLAVNNLIHFLNIEKKVHDSDEHSSEDEVYYEVETQNIGCQQADLTASVLQSSSEKIMSDATYSQIGVILRYMWAKMRSNNDIVCYCCFVMMFLWNFSLLSMVYLMALFLYALCINTGPSYMFWIIMLIYTEFCVLLQYLYQIIIQHCGFTLHVSYLQELGFPSHRIVSSFVMSNLPLFLVYLFTLIQTSITTRDSDWANMVTEFSFNMRKNHFQQDFVKSYSCSERIQRLFLPVRNAIKQVTRSLFRYWKSLTEGAETPPYFVQLSMEVTMWPEDSIQPERIESGINRLLKILHDNRCKEKNMNRFHSPSRVQVQSIERSPENSDVALAVFEVVYASPPTESISTEWYKSLTPAADVAGEILTAQRDGILNEIRFPYPILSVIGSGKREIDLYAYTFCADLAVFFLVAIFYQAVIKNKSEFLEVYQLEDQFPKEFVFILMAIFFLIVLDRIIYLRSFATGKVIFFLFNLFLFTYSITRYAWNIELSHGYAGRLALRVIYMTKAISLALQAIQIRFGMPHKSTLYRQFLTSSISQINFLGFRLYRALPFLYELRCVLDWSCTTTSLTMYDWLKLEDIHGSLFLVKCDVDLNRASHQQGQKQTKMTKFCNGICLFFILMCVIWAPMLMYSSGNPTNIANPIKDASVRIDINTVGGRLILFETTLCEKLSWNELDMNTKMDTHGYLRTYNEQDIQLICCQAGASSLWLVPPVVQARYMNSLQRSMDIIFSWQFTRDRPKGKESVKYELTVQDQDLPKPSEVMEVLNGTANSFTIYNMYPRYFRVTGSGEVRFLENEEDLVSGNLVLNRGNPEWWSFHDIDASNVSGCGELKGPLAIVVSEETPQGILGETLSKFSIWGLYITFVLAVGRFIRLQCSDLRMRIPFENLPSCDRLLAICEDIYAARAEGELEVEEVLYWTLIKIYRSPHMLFEYTKMD
ncbi:hypothetical protein L484_020660 [Morus notabilis]|uniref:Piezo non-specific cation channel R-Ras-binding domain-containing protein n=1 Tax=Morus notabilis TaxID=981085 RepID=W9S996_9ROSA|nr:hypothetical protein L484_020660 [Morus notabilis]